ELCFRRPAAGTFQFEREAVAVVPEQEVCGTRKDAHAAEFRAGDLVAAFTVRNMEPQHVRLGPQAQMRDHGAVSLPFGRCPASGAAHYCLSRAMWRSASRQLWLRHARS